MRHVLFSLLLVLVCYNVSAKYNNHATNFEKLLCEYDLSDLSTDTLIKINSEKPSKIRFGFRLGMGMSRANFNKGYPKPDTRFDVAYKPSFSAGILLKVNIYNKLYLQQEYMFTKIKGAVRGVNVDYNLDYVSLPVLLIYEATPKLALVIGPQFDLLVWANETHSGSTINLIHHMEERNISGGMGLSYKVSDYTYLYGRYTQSLNHIGIKEGILAKEFKIDLIQISLIVVPFKN